MALPGDNPHTVRRGHPTKRLVSMTCGSREDAATGYVSHGMMVVVRFPPRSWRQCS